VPVSQTAAETVEDLRAVCERVVGCVLVALTLARIDRHSGQLDELDVEGIVAFAERVLPRAADLWVQASLEQRQRFQQLFFPDGIAFDGKGFVGTRVTAPAFSYLREIKTGNERMVGHSRQSALDNPHSTRFREQAPAPPGSRQCR
jgi:hypothetical protein